MDIGRVATRMDWITVTVPLAVLCLSGAIYYIAWDFTFPLPIGRLLWRIFCSLITVAPFASMVVTFILCLIVFPIILLMKSNVPQNELEDLGRKMGTIVFVIFYSTCRLMLVSLALWSLHNLPFDAHETVSWSRYMPHV